MTGREKIIAAATRLFVRKGFQATSVDEIAAEAGISKGLTYHYFASKNDLLEQIIFARLDELDWLVAALRGEPAAAGRLRLLVSQMVTELREDEAGHRFAVTTYLHPECKPVVARAMARAPERFDALHAEERRLLADLGFDADAELPLFRATLQGMAVLYLLNPETFDLDTAAQRFIQRYTAGN